MSKLKPVNESLVLDTSGRSTRISASGKVFRSAVLTESGKLMAVPRYGLVDKDVWALSLHVRIKNRPFEDSYWECLLRIPAEKPESEAAREAACMALLDALSSANGGIPVRRYGR